MNEGQIEKSCRNSEAQRRNLHATSCERSLLYVYSICIRLVNWRARFAKILDFLLPRLISLLGGCVALGSTFNVHFCDGRTLNLPTSCHPCDTHTLLQNLLHWRVDLHDFPIFTSAYTWTNSREFSLIPRPALSCIAIITFPIYCDAQESHLWYFLEEHGVPKIRRLAAPDSACMSRKWGSGFERYERTFIGVETLSSFQVAWSHRNERELFSTRRKVNNRCTTNICSEFYFSSLSYNFSYV